jgi:hypothetical protein
MDDLKELLKSYRDAAGKIPLALWDLDSSLCDTQHRHWIIPEIKARKKTWDDYSLLCVDDTPILGPIAVMRALDSHFHFALSGRAECARENTYAWQVAHEIPLDELILRPTGSRVNVGVWKVAKIRQLLKMGWEISFMAEDNPDIGHRIYNETGVPVLGLNPFYINDHTQYGAV